MGLSLVKYRTIYECIKLYISPDKIWNYKNNTVSSDKISHTINLIFFCNYIIYNDFKILNINILCDL